MQVGDGIGDLFQIAGNVAAHQHAVLLVLDEVQQQVQQFAAHHRVQPCGGFVQDQQLRVVGQGGGKAQFHPHAAAVLFNFFAAVQLKTTHQRVKFRSVPALAKDARHAFAHAGSVEAIREIGILKHHADAGADGGVGRGAAQQFHAAAGRPDGPAQQFQRSGLACTVLTDQAQDTARRDRKVDGTQGKCFIMFRSTAQSGGCGKHSSALP